jgi:hypothetical protein
MQSFIEANCGYFMGIKKGEAATPEILKIHKQFTMLVDSLMQLLLSDIGID